MTDPSIKNHSQTIKKVYRIWSFYLSRLLTKTPVTANQITLFRIVLICGAAYCILADVYYLHLFAAVLIVLYSMFDALDGTVATMKDQRSVLGAWLDPQIDRLGFLLLFLAIGYHLSVKSEFYIYLCFYTLMMFYFRGLVNADIRLKDKFALLREGPQIIQPEALTAPSVPKGTGFIRKLIKRIHLEANPHTHNVALYVAVGLVLGNVEVAILWVSCYVTAWYIWENIKIIRKAKEL